MTPKIKALKAQIESGKIKTDAAKILNFIIERGESNSVHMESILRIFNKTLSARLSELEDLGLVYKSGTFENGAHSIYKYESNEDAQKRLRAKRSFEKFEVWKKRGLERFNKFLTDEAIEALQKNLY